MNVGGLKVYVVNFVEMGEKYIYGLENYYKLFEIFFKGIDLMLYVIRSKLEFLVVSLRCFFVCCFKSF